MHHLLLSKIDFTPSEHWQHVVSRQDLGTFYSIYIKLNSVKEKNQKNGKDENSIYLYDFDFYLQNFEGPITMGLHKIKVSQPSQKDDFDYSFELFCKPFFVNSTIKSFKMEMVHKFEKGKIFDFHVIMDVPPHDIFNQRNLEHSEYVSPFHFVRDGEEFFEIEYKGREGMGKHGDSKRCYPRRAIVI